MTITIYPTPLSGKIIAPSSKSFTHRALICAALAHGASEIIDPLFSEDTLYTKEALSELGVKFSMGQNKLTVTRPKRFIKVNKMINCGDSGSTIRFLIPLLSFLQSGGTLKGSKRLIERLNDNDLKAIGLNYLKTPNTINIFPSHLKPNLMMNVNHSTQLVSGLLMAAPMLKEELTITVNSPHLDAYIIMTIAIMEHFGVRCTIKHLTEQSVITVLPMQDYQSQQITIEGDYSSAANLLVMGLLGKSVTVKRLNPNSLQADRKVIELLKEMNGKIEVTNEFVKTSTSNLSGTTIDLSLHPDLGPLLMGLASICNGNSRFTGLERLYYKESNRVDDTVKLLTTLGAKIEKIDDNVIIYGQEQLQGGVTVDSFNDHRLVMMVSAISSKFIAPVKIKNAHVVEKSYPNFWHDFYTLGGSFVKED